MTSSLAVIAIDAVDPTVVADFWCAVLGWVVLEQDEGIVSIGSPSGSWPTIDVCRVPEGKTVKNRLHFDLRAEGVGQSVELQRLLDLGAVPADVGQQPEVSWVVLADPEGNEFCLLARTVQEARGEVHSPASGNRAAMDHSADAFDVSLPTFSVLARFKAAGGSDGDAERSVVTRLTAAEEPFHEVSVERQEDDGTWMILVRFVLVSVDGHTAVLGLHESLTAADLSPDEVWLDRQLA